MIINRSENWVRNLQAVAYNGAHTVYAFTNIILSKAVVDQEGPTIFLAAFQLAAEKKTPFLLQLENFLALLIL